MANNSKDFDKIFRQAAIDAREELRGKPADVDRLKELTKQNAKDAIERSCMNYAVELYEDYLETKSAKAADAYLENRKPQYSGQLDLIESFYSDYASEPRWTDPDDGVSKFCNFKEIDRTIWQILHDQILENMVNVQEKYHVFLKKFKKLKPILVANNCTLMEAVEILKREIENEIAKEIKRPRPAKLPPMPPASGKPGPDSTGANP